MKFEVKHKWNGSILFTAEIEANEETATSIKIGLAVKWGYAKGAYLKGADLKGADLKGAYLKGAYLEGADLKGAYLEGIKYDVWRVLSQNPAEVQGLLDHLRQGKIDGSCYEGECACLVGTIANIKKCDYHTLSPNSNSPAEVWFMNIYKGHVPESNGFAKITEGWILEWLEQNKKAA